MHRRIFALVLSLSALGAVGCGGGVGSEEDAKAAYQGLDLSIDKAIQLGFDGFNAATSANIADQKTTGKESGTMVIGGQVDQGASDNKTMNLTEKLTDYSDVEKYTYNTKDTPPLISLKLSKIPDGTLTGEMHGEYVMSGELEGDVILDLTFEGALQPVGGDNTKVERKPGTTKILGTAESPYGTYKVSLTR